MNDHEVFAEARGVGKKFGDRSALVNANLSCRSGEIHALVGENGAGKSTLAGIFSGVVRPNSGHVTVFGSEISSKNFKAWSPRRARELGVAMVYQRSMLVPELTVPENVAFSSKGFIYSESSWKARVEKLSQDFGLNVPTDCKITELSAGDRQRAELIRSLARGARFLILDEPTSVLTPSEVDSLFRVLRNLGDRGCSILFISHKLDEVTEIADRTTVLRAGETVSTHLRGELTAQGLAALAIGSVGEQGHSPSVRAGGAVTLKLDGVSASGTTERSSLDRINLEIRSGELVGIAGVEGNGQKEFEEVLVGIRSTLAGRVLVNGRELVPAIRTLRSMGISVLSGNRPMGGLVADLTIAENLVSKGSYDDRRFFSRWRMKHKTINRYAKDVVEGRAIRPADSSRLVGSLSGGNAQKVTVAREIDSAMSGLIAFQPTRGLDKAAADSVHRQILDLREKGMAILIVSADLEEILKLADRIFVMREGSLSAVHEDATKRGVGSLMLSGERK